MNVTPPSGHFVPTGRDPQVTALAQASSAIAEGYVKLTVDPMIDRLRQHARAQTLRQERLFDSARDDIEQLRSLVHALPASLNEVISRSKDLAEVESNAQDFADPTIHRKISQMTNAYPWMAPQLVQLRHALSQQAIEDNVAIPAARQIGFG